MLQAQAKKHAVYEEQEEGVLISLSAEELQFIQIFRQLDPGARAKLIADTKLLFCGKETAKS